MNTSSHKKSLFSKSNHPIKIVQFGEGNFLRAFVGDVIHQLNQKTNYNGGIAVVQPIANGLISELDRQGELTPYF